MDALAWVIGIGIGLHLLFRFPKQVGALAVVIAVLAGCVWLYFYSEGEKTRRQLASLDADARVSSELCADPNYPIFVSFINRSGKTLEYVSFSIQAKRPNHSQNVYSNYQSSDRIIPDGDGHGNCWAIAAYSKPDWPPNELIWSVEMHSARFQ